MTNVIRQLIVLKSVKDDKNFLSAHFIFTFTRISCFPRQSLNPGVVTTVIYFGVNGRGNVREAVICHCGNMLEGVFVIIILIVENHNGAFIICVDMHQTFW